MKKRYAMLCVCLLPLLALLAPQRAETLAVQAMANTAERYIQNAGAEQSGAVQATPTEQEEKYLALTFDDGPWPETTEKLLDGLAARGAHATFFLIGEQIDGMVDTVLRMAEEGHQVGNHTFTHVRLDIGATSAALYEIDKTNSKLTELLGEDTYWLRPPWGFIGPETASALTVPMVHWSVDTEDWKRLNAEGVASCIINNAKSGDIILLHDPYATSVEAALTAIDELSRQGFSFVTLEELFARMAVEPEVGILYSRPDTVRQGK